MLQALKKKKRKYQVPPQAETRQITCGACGHERKPEASAPDWQCPCCGKAYAKVNTPGEGEKLSPQQQYNKEFAKKREQKKRQERRKKKEAENRNQNASIAHSIGALAIAKGLGKAASACVKVATPANPALLILGGLIIAGALLYQWLG